MMVLQYGVHTHKTMHPHAAYSRYLRNSLRTLATTGMEKMVSIPSSQEVAALGTSLQGSSGGVVDEVNLPRGHSRSFLEVQRESFCGLRTHSLSLFQLHVTAARGLCIHL